MKKSFNIILSLVLLVSVFSCSKDESIFKEGYGYLKMNLSANEEINIETKAPGEVYAFDILDAAGKAVESYTDHRELQGKPIKLKPGAYKINATTGENVAAGWDSPFYSGTKDVEVVANATATANVVCYISNVMVKIELDETMEVDGMGTILVSSRRFFLFCSLMPRHLPFGIWEAFSGAYARPGSG